MRPIVRPVWFALALAGPLACVDPPLSGRVCASDVDCVGGFVCEGIGDDGSGECVSARDAGADGRDGGVDAGQDAGAVDAGYDGGTDAGAVDAGYDGGTDAGALDAGYDAGAVDAGYDGGTDAGAVDAGYDAGADAGVDGGFDAGVDDPCGYVELTSLRAAGRNYQGLAFGNGRLLGFDITPTPNEIIDIPTDGGPASTWTPATFPGNSLSAAASDTRLYLGDEGGGQLIHVVDLITKTEVDILPGHLTGGNRGLAELGGHLWHLGVYGSSGLGFVEIDPDDGGVVSFVATPDAIRSSNAAATDDALLFVTAEQTAGDCLSFDCDLRVHLLRTDGTAICDAVIGTTEEEPMGAAASGDHLWLVDRPTSSIRVFER
jgi:hypothetical protein